MALTTFSFEADLPAGPDFMAVLDALLRHAVAYTATDADPAAVLALVTAGAGPDARVVLRFDHDDEGFTIVLSAAHFVPSPSTPLPVVVTTEAGRVVYRLHHPRSES
jgi:hypothetical protein